MALFIPVVKAVLVGAALLTSPVSAHTWVEQLMAIAPNGTMVGSPGFPRGNIQRGTAGFSDTAMVYLIPPNGGPPNKIDANQLMCRPEQTKQAQTSGNPRLKAAPGQAVALRYQENGHVTLPNNTPGKPIGGGTNFVYFTNSSKPDDKFLQIHRQWTPDGKGGDGRGKLISTQNFDDGQCYQINGDTISKQRQVAFPHQFDKVQGSDLWCQQDIQIPADAEPDTTITLYWVWDWPTMPGTQGFPEGKQEIYTTCVDIDVVKPAGAAKAVVDSSNKFVKQDLAHAAVSSQFENIANPTAVKAQTIPFSNVNAANPSTSARQSMTTVTRSNSVVPTTLPSSSSSSLSPPASSARPSVSPIASINPGQVTVTVDETVTATTLATRTRKGRPSGAPAATETKFVTVVVTQTVVNKRQDASPAPVASSTAEQAYRLRARNPFYIVPSQKSAESSTSTNTMC